MYNLENLFEGRDLYGINLITNMPSKGRYARIKRAKALVNFLVNSQYSGLLVNPDFYRSLGLLGRDTYIVIFSGYYASLSWGATRFMIPSTNLCLKKFTEADKRFRKFKKGGANLIDFHQINLYGKRTARVTHKIDSAFPKMEDFEPIFKDGFISSFKRTVF
jgi:hypothetical protein